MPARHAINPGGVPGAPLGLGDPLGGALEQLAADRQAELGDLAGGLRRGGRELGAARARRPGLLEVLAAGADARAPRRGRGAGATRRGALARRPPRGGGRLERARGGGLRLRLRGRFAFAFAFVARLRGAAVAGVALAAASAAGVGSNVRGAAAFGFGFAVAASASPSRPPSSPRRPSRSRSAARPPSPPRWWPSSARGSAPSGAPGAGTAAAARALPVLPRRVPIRSGRALESEPSTPGSSFFAFAFCFLGLSAMSTRV